MARAPDEKVMVTVSLSDLHKALVVRDALATRRLKAIVAAEMAAVKTPRTQDEWDAWMRKRARS